MQCWGLTDPGCVRKQNQDAYQIEQLDRGSILCVVCDGMGGAKSGNVASTLAVDVFVQEVKRTWTSDMDQERIDQMLAEGKRLAGNALSFLSSAFCLSLIQDERWTWYFKPFSAFGFMALVGIAWIMKLSSKLQSSGNIDLGYAIGKVGTVYIPVPASMKGSGKVNLTIQERFIEVNAVTTADRKLTTGESVRVVATDETGMLVVEPLAK